MRSAPPGRPVLGKLTGMTTVIGIIGAMPEEIDLLKEGLQRASEKMLGGFSFFSGTLEGKPVVLTKSGIGKVNAALCTQLLLQEGAGAVIFTGVAGALDPGLRVGDLVVSTDALQHDVDVTPLDYELGQVPGEPLSWQAGERLYELALKAARSLEDVRVKEGRIVSGDQFIADPVKAAWLHETFGAACAEMEGASTAQVCSKYGVPFVIIRSISDSANFEAGPDFREFTRLAAIRAERLVRLMLRQL